MIFIRAVLALLGLSNTSTLSDEEVVQKYIETQRSHYFEILYSRYSKKIYAKSISLLHDESLSEDTTQEIMMKLLLNLSKFGNKSKFSTWVYSITHNYCIDKLRKRQKNPNILVEDVSIYEKGSEDIDDGELTHIKLERLKVIIELISVHDKSILLMKYMDNMSIKEISQVLDKSESAVKMKIKRAKERFIRVYNEKYS